MKGFEPEATGPINASGPAGEMEIFGAHHLRRSEAYLPPDLFRGLLFEQ